LDDAWSSWLAGTGAAQPVSTTKELSDSAATKDLLNIMTPDYLFDQRNWRLPERAQRVKFTANTMVL
jgi:hypothetical protein